MVDTDIIGTVTLTTTDFIRNNNMTLIYLGLIIAAVVWAIKQKKNIEKVLT